MIHFFISDNSDSSFHNIRLEAWAEHKDVLYNDTGEKASSFTRVEQIKLFYSKNPEYQTKEFRIDFGKDGCRGHNARNPRDLTKALTEGEDFFGTEFKKVSDIEYESYRNFVFEVHQQEMRLDIQDLEKQLTASVNQKTKIIN